MVASIVSKTGLCAQVVDDVRQVYELVSASDDPVKKGKEVLLLTQNRGAFIKECPGTSHYTCCGYKILHIGSFCTMDCSYCILQSYFHPPVLQFFVNHETLFKELDAVLKSPGIKRIGTGEFTDSMIWEKWIHLSGLLVPVFADQHRAVLELKTKTVAIDGLKDLKHERRTIMSWSVNTESVIASEERGTSSLSARLHAASRCESWGYPLAFHFDPMVIYDGCEEDYIRVVKQIFSNVSAENIVWISIGTFRFIPSLKAICEKRFLKSIIVYGEFIQGLDNKMRYFKPLRIRLYKKIVAAIRDIAPDVLVYMCMEDDEVWKKSLGFTPEERGGLCSMLDKSAVSHCNLYE